jgi:hypothetical protein
MIATIMSVGKRELMREGRIAMRTIEAAWAGNEVADNALKRMADAAGRIASRKEKVEKEQDAAVAWLKERRKQMGLAALSTLLAVDAANLTKAIAGQRSLPRGLLDKVRATSNQAGRGPVGG